MRLNPLPQTIYERVENKLASLGFAISFNYIPEPSDQPLKLKASFKNSASMTSMQISGTQGFRNSRENKLRVWRMGPGGSPPEGSLSGRSLGEYCYHINTELTKKVHVLGDRYDIEVTVPFKRDANEEVMRERDLAASRICESITRYILAEAMTIDLDDNGRELPSSRLTGLETPKTGFIPLTGWAAREHVQIAYDAATSSASFTKNSKTVKLYLASSKAVVNGEEVSLGGKFIMARGNRWFVPDSELLAAIQ